MITIEEAIEIGADECHCPLEVMSNALRLMMPAIRAAIIEECALVADEYNYGGSGVEIAAAVRASKDK